MAIRLSENFVYDVLARFFVYDVLALNTYCIAQPASVFSRFTLPADKIVCIRAVDVA